MKRIEQLEQTGEKAPESPENVFSKPIFTQLLIGPAEVLEGQSAYFEARVVPVGDPNLTYEWFKNGSELKFGKQSNRVIPNQSLISNFNRFTDSLF